MQEETAVTAGGLMLPESARERPMSGAVVSVGPGKRDKDGSRKTPKVMLGACYYCGLHASYESTCLMHIPCADAPRQPQALTA